MDALANLGIDIKLLAAQIINFVLLMFILKRYAYQPMLRLMDERAAKIEKGLKDAEAAEQKLRSIEEEEKTILAGARQQAKELLVETDKAAKERDALKLSETEARVKKLFSDAEVKLEDDRTRMIEDAKRELSETVMLAVEKILKEKTEK
ncbi:MAG: F0F1 ATP synthase subunit B [Candidatus Moranbacteria bacterium]|nr:F0F1 ATP synthase subunit B [Candidatus Moranbacteria bacterium]MBP6034097.1 F0F1 ATP synthase subunit B [Candidatus Moranbacteria bacterium]MBP7695849.1 F0F1 ATP synthase subunit B [Candidatus Moranbacteria bacterium]